MSDTKTPESAYSGERTTITEPNSLRSTKETAKPSGSEETAPAAKPTQSAQVTALPESPRTGGSFPETSHPSEIGPGGINTLGDFAEFLKRTQRIWLIAAGAIFGVMAIVTVTKRMSEQAKKAQAARQEQAVATVTVDGLLARCGQPAEDVTKEMYPIVVRTMSYQPRENEKVVFEFSRTAEEKSDWVFLSMKDGGGTRKFDTPEAKIAALPCLDTKK